MEDIFPLNNYHQPTSWRHATFPLSACVLYMLGLGIYARGLMCPRVAKQIRDKQRLNALEIVINASAIFAIRPRVSVDWLS